MELPFDPEIPLLVIYSKEVKAGTETGICTPAFTADITHNIQKVEAIQVAIN